MAEITPTGFIAKTEQEYFDEERQLYLDIDPQWNLDPSSPDGLKLASDAEIFTNLDEAAQVAYNSKDPNRARGTELDIIASLTGTFRDLGSPSTVTLQFTGTDGTVIPQGQLFESTVDGTQWATSADVTITGGIATVNATATVNGAISADIGTITRIVTSIGGLASVTNTTVASLGRDKESNPDLRLRRAKSVSRPGNNQVDSMLGEILATEGVTQAVIFENDTDVTDSNGLPPHSIAPIVDGGTDDAVALSIYLKKNPGCALHAAGTQVQVNVTSPKYPQNSKLITFSRPVYVDMAVVVGITDDGTLPTNVGDLIAQAIVDYSQGRLVAAECGFNVLGFAIGEDVPVSRINTPINQVIGQYGNSYVTSLTVNGNSSGLINIAFNELSRWTVANVTVNVT